MTEDTQHHALQQTILQGYLRQQLNEVQQAASSSQPYNNNANALVPAASVRMPTNAELETFKGQVRAWIELDNTLKKLQAAARERRATKQQLTEKITSFMARFNIEDLSTRDGKIRFKTVMVKPNLSRKALQQRLIEAFPSTHSADELMQRVFVPSPEERVERPTLRRVSVRTSRVDTQ
jgi:hypothetical protein